MGDPEAIDRFGRQFIEVARDGTIESFDRTFDGEMTYPGADTIAREFAALGESQRVFVRQLVTAIVDEAVHNSLSVIDQLDWVTLLAVNDETGVRTDLKGDGGGLTWMLEDEDGWVHTFGRYPRSDLT
jgi:hypothetical protein